MNEHTICLISGTTLYCMLAYLLWNIFFFSSSRFTNRSCIDQGDRWAIEFRSGLTLFDLIKLWTPWGGYGEEKLNGDEIKFVQLCVDMSIWSMVAILGVGSIQVKGEIVRIMTWIHREGWLMSDMAVFSGSVISLSWIQVFFILIEGVCLGLGEFYGL